MTVQQVWVYRFLRLDGGEPSESWDDTAARHSRNVNTLSMDGWSLHHIAWPWMVFRKRGLKKGQEDQVFTKVAGSDAPERDDT
jgi:hypothetical protein